MKSKFSITQIIFAGELAYEAIPAIEHQATFAFPDECVLTLISSFGSNLVNASIAVGPTIIHTFNIANAQSVNGHESLDQNRSVTPTEQINYNKIAIRKKKL